LDLSLSCRISGSFGLRNRREEKRREEKRRGTGALSRGVDLRGSRIENFSFYFYNNIKKSCYTFNKKGL
jgi:hypothetical protein